MRTRKDNAPRRILATVFSKPAVSSIARVVPQSSGLVALPLSCRWRRQIHILLALVVDRLALRGRVRVILTLVEQLLRLPEGNARQTRIHIAFEVRLSARPSGKRDPVPATGRQRTVDVLKTWTAARTLGRRHSFGRINRTVRTTFTWFFARFTSHDSSDCAPLRSKLLERFRPSE